MSTPAQRMLLLFGGDKNSLVIYTAADASSTFDPSWVFSAGGGPMTVNWGDGSARESHATALSHTYANGSTKAVKFSCPDWSKVTTFNVNNDVCKGVCPDFSRLNKLTYWGAYVNQFEGTCPSFAACSELETWYGNANKFTGTVPSFASCLKLVTWFGYNNLFSDYQAGGFATQKSLASLQLSTTISPVAELPITAIDAILADLVTSLGIGGRVTCAVDLSGGANYPPSTPTGQNNVATLAAAGWTVTVNKDPRIVVIGDSIAVQWSAPLHTGYKAGVNYVVQLAYGGANIITFMSQQVATPVDHDAAYVFVAMGTNDSVHDDTLRATYEANLNNIISLNPASTVFGLGILNRTDMTNVVDKNSYIETACNNAGATYVDTSSWIVAATDTSDGLHLNAGGIVKVVNALIALLPA